MGVGSSSGVGENAAVRSHERWIAAVAERPEKRFWYEWALESGLVPDAVIRAAIRRMLRERLREEDRGSEAANLARMKEFVRAMKAAPIALRVESANAQHYEVPAEFFVRALGPRMKYSSAWYERGDETLGEAEEAMLALTCARAELADGQDVLELGCGWGSLTLWMAEKFPGSRITGVSNSASQREFILRQAAERGLGNVRIVTADMNSFEAEFAGFDRVVSVEMFEHMRNWEMLLRRVAGWLRDDGGKFFLHIFVHRKFAYPFEVRGDGDWMAQHFFTGGMMPSFDLVRRFDEDLRVRGEWWVSGLHYARTSEDWLRRMDGARGELMGVMRATYGEAEARRWWVRWRVFFMACAELWGYRGGAEWGVGHYLMEKA